MAKLRVHNFSVSLDGYAAGPDQGADHPLGVGGDRLHDWFFRTRRVQRVLGRPGGETNLDDAIAARGEDGIGATIMGRNMFGPVRGPWNGSVWRGWWGEEPPFHHPVFVLTRHPRDPIEMDGGTMFHFVTDGPDAALERAFVAADGLDVRVGGGAATLQQYLCRGLVDELHLAVVPVLLGRGARLFESLAELPERYEVAEVVSSAAVIHVRLTRTRSAGTR